MPDILFLGQYTFQCMVFNRYIIVVINIVLTNINFNDIDIDRCIIVIDNVSQIMPGSHTLQWQCYRQDYFSNYRSLSGISNEAFSNKKMCNT